MQIQKIVFINRAPFGNLELDFEEHGINVLSAINGKGKTTILSQIVDAFHEMAKITYSNSYSGEFEGKYYRVISSRYSLNPKAPSLAYIRFIHNDETYDYIEMAGRIREEVYSQINIVNKIPYEKIASSANTSNNLKLLSSNITTNNVKSIFETSILTYFPAYRFEIPGFMNQSYSDKLLYDISPKYSGYLTNPIEVVSDLPQLANWLMDLVLDWSIYKDSNSSQLKTVLNKLLSLALETKTKTDVRLGIGHRNNSSVRISVVHDEGDDIKTIYPSIFEISSGEAALLCLFGEILHQSDRIGQILGSSDISRDSC